MKIPSREKCFELIRQMGMMEHIIDHSVMVSNVAFFLCSRLAKTNCKLDSSLAMAGGLLHDITKTRSFKTGEFHSETGKELLDELGYPEIADIIKVDFLNTKGADRWRIMDKIGTRNKKYLAEKVETHEDFDEAVIYGYEYFQGYFFGKPTIVSGTDIPVHKQNNLQMIHAINTPDTDFDVFEKLISAIREIIEGKKSFSTEIQSLIIEDYTNLHESQKTIDVLTKREKEILSNIAGGLMNKEIAAKLNISVRTVEFHRANIMEKLDIKNVAGLVKFAIEHGLDN